MAKLRNFLITFVVAVLVFGAIAYVAVQSIMNPGFSLFPGEETTVPSDNTKETTEKPTTESTPVQSSGNDTTSSSEPVTDPPIEDDSCLTFLLVGTDYQPDVFDDYESRSSESGGLPDKGRNINADTIFLLHINKEKRYFVFSSLPPNLKISTASGIYTTLSDVYRQNGIESLIANVRSLTGLEADYYAVVSIPSCSKTVIISFSAVAVHPPACGLPFSKRTFAIIILLNIQRNHN